MIRAIFFDFDGVILESAQIKTKAFRELFANWPDKVDEVVKYHIGHAGLSRYVKFRHLYENILKLPYSKEIELKFGRQYTKLVLDEVKKAPFVSGVENFLDEFSQKLQLFIVSGTPQAELNDVVKIRDLTRYFERVRGSPPEKEILLRTIMKDFGLVGEQCVYVGEGQTDMEAAKAVGMMFILRMTQENMHLRGQIKHAIQDMTMLKELLLDIHGGASAKN